MLLLQKNATILQVAVNFLYTQPFLGGSSMPFKRGAIFCILSVFIFLCAPLHASLEGSNSAAVRGTVTDSSGAVIPGATIQLVNEVSGLNQTASTDTAGQFVFANIPFNPYRISVSANGFAPLTRSIEVRSAVGADLSLVLAVAASSQTVTVEASGDLVESDPTFHTDIDRNLLEKVPMGGDSSGLSSLVTISTPGISADSDGQMHGLGDHAENSYSVDGQSMTNQQSKVFSNQIPANSIQSIEVISGAPPAEYGGKTSLVIVATTRSGQGVAKLTGSHRRLRSSLRRQELG
jgi:outer membrane receptor protein involved in Fe transport